MELTTTEHKINWLDSVVGGSGRHKNPDLARAHAAKILSNDQVEWALSYLKGFKDMDGRLKVPQTCALVSMAFLKQGVGVPSYMAPELYRPYEKQVGSAPTIIQNVAHRAKCWRSKDFDTAWYNSLRVGGVIQIGTGAPGSAVHYSIFRALDNGLIVSVDGGQNDGSWTLERTRMLLNGHLVDPDRPIVNGAPNGRKITGYLDIDGLEAVLETL